MKDHAKTNNPAYFRFIDLAVEKMGESALPLNGAAAACCAQTVLRMVREEFVYGGEKQLLKILNINGDERRAKERREKRNGKS